MTGRTQRSRGIFWARGWILSLALVFLYSGPALGQGGLEEAQSLNQQVVRLYQEGRYREAIPLAERSLAIAEKALGPDHPDVATGLNNLAGLYDSLGDYAQAEPLYRRALAISEKALGPDHPNVAGSKGNIAALYLARGKLEEAYEILKGYKVSTGLGRYHLLKGDYRAAQEQFRQALEYFQKTRESVHLLASYIGLGLSLEGLEQYSKAADSFQRAVELMEEQRAALTPAARTHFLGGQVGVFERILAYEGLVRVKGKLQDPAGAFYWSEYTKARLLPLGLARAKGSLGLPPDPARREEALTDRLAGLYRQREAAFAKNPALFQKIEEEELPRAKEELARFISALRRDHPAYAALKYPQPLPAAELALRPQEALLAYEVTEKESFAWLVRGGEVIRAATIPITRQELTQQVKQYRRFFEGITAYPELSRFEPRVGKKLYDLLFKDLVPFLKPGERLILVPDEILGILPFEALVVELPAGAKTASGKYGPYPQEVRYLGDLYSISYSQSAAAFSLARTLKGTGAGKKEKMLVVADPVFDPTDERFQGKEERVAQRDEYQMRLMRVIEEEWKGGQAKGPAFNRLEITGQLAEKFKRSYGDQVDILKGPQATEQELRRRPLEQYGYQLFATHGILDGEIPYLQEPALVLSLVGVDSGRREQDGFLTLSEVMDLKLDAENVALTACNTGVGKNLTGEGVMGLGRAFQYAGARAVLMSLWSVEDESTNLLTEKFFGHLKAGKDRLEALRLARADLRQAGYEHPFFWAPFILVGER